MHRSRVIPCLLLHKGGLVKTTQFSKPRYIGDPINTVRILNEKEADELLFLDIGATATGSAPKIDLIQEIVSEAFMPICYGGGVTTIGQMRQLFRAGVEKVSLSSAALRQPDLISEAAREFGSQAVIVTLDIRKTSRWSGKYSVVIHNGQQQVSGDPVDLARKMEELGAGELVLSFVDRDSVMAGYDVGFVGEVSRQLQIPVIALGGAGSLQDIREVIRVGGAAAAAAGSLFVYYGKHRAVLINYPSQKELSDLFEENAENVSSCV
jgi:cyclase